MNANRDRRAPAIEVTNCDFKFSALPFINSQSTPDIAGSLQETPDGILNVSASFLWCVSAARKIQLGHVGYKHVSFLEQVGSEGNILHAPPSLNCVLILLHK